MIIHGTTVERTFITHKMSKYRRRQLSFSKNRMNDVCRVVQTNNTVGTSFCDAISQLRQRSENAIYEPREMLCSNNRLHALSRIRAKSFTRFLKGKLTGDNKNLAALPLWFGTHGIPSRAAGKIPSYIFSRPSAPM